MCRSGTAAERPRAYNRLEAGMQDITKLRQWLGPNPSLDGSTGHMSHLPSEAALQGCCTRTESDACHPGTDGHGVKSLEYEHAGCVSRAVVGVQVEQAFGFY